jgi:hypothetical protein
MEDRKLINQHFLRNYRQDGSLAHFFSFSISKDIVLVVLAAIVIASAIEPATNWCMKAS